MMATKDLPNTYKIVFFGLIEAEENREDVMVSFSSLFNIKKQSTLEHLFSGSMVVLKRGISHDVASKYQEAIRSIGADCSIEPDTALGQFSGTDISYERKKKRLLSSLHTKDLSNIGIEPKI